MANLIYKFGRESGFSKDYGFKDQIQRAAVSVMNNIAEGFERGSNKDFAKFLFIAKGSVGGFGACCIWLWIRSILQRDRSKRRIAYVCESRSFAGD